MTLTHKVLLELNGPGTPLIDVTADVDQQDGITWAWGRTDWLSADPSAGTLSFSLDNRTGDYTPGSPNGTYVVGCAEGVGVLWWVGDPAGNATAALGRTLSFRMGVPTITFPTSSGGASFVEVSCVDVLAQLQGRLMRSMFDETVLSVVATPPAAYWPLTETSGATAGQDVAGLNVPALVQASSVNADNVQWAQAGGIPSESTGALYLNSGAPVSGSSTVVPFTASGHWGLNYLQTPGELSCPTAASNPAWTLAGWVTAPRLSNMSGGFYAALCEMQMAGGWTVGLIMDRSNGALLVSSSLSTSNVLLTNANLTDGGTHFVALSVSKVGANLSFSFVVDTSVTVLGGGMFGHPADNRPVSFTLGAAPQSTFPTNCMDWTGAAHHFALWPIALPSSALTTIGAAGRNGFTNDTAAGRVARFLTFVDYPIDNFSTGSALNDRLEVQDTAGQYMLPMISVAMAGEGGQFAADPFYTVPNAGDVMPNPRLITQFQAALNRPIASVTVDAVSQCVGAPKIAGNLTGRVLSATATGRHGSATFTDFTLTGITTSTATVAAGSSDPGFLARLAQNRVVQARDPNPQVTSVTIDLNTSEPPGVNGWLPVTLRLLPAARLRVSNLPAAALGRSYSEHFVSGGSEVYTLTRQEVTFLLQPADSPAIAQFQTSTTGLPDSLWRFTADDSNTLPVTYTPTATTITVNYPAGSPWSTTPADYPLSVNIGGECVRFTGPPTTTTGTQQTFTGCVRGYDGTLPRRLNAGAMVDIWLSPAFSI